MRERDPPGDDRVVTGDVRRRVAVAVLQLHVQAGAELLERERRGRQVDADASAIARASSMLKPALGVVMRWRPRRDPERARSRAPAQVPVGRADQPAGAPSISIVTVMFQRRPAGTVTRRDATTTRNVMSPWTEAP